nr:hypothetical protein [Tanacetum cinerariifolium]
MMKGQLEEEEAEARLEDHGVEEEKGGNKEWFSKLEEGFSRIVKLGNNMKMEVITKGNLRFQVNGLTKVFASNNLREPVVKNTRRRRATKITISVGEENHQTRREEESLTRDELHTEGLQTQRERCGDNKKRAQRVFTPARYLRDMTKESGDTLKKEVANGLWEMIESNEKTEADNKKDKTVIAFLYQALPEEQLLQITKYKTDFEMLQIKEDETIDAFTTKLTTLVNEASSLRHTMKDETLVRKLLNAVPDRYLQIVASIEQYSDLSEMTFEEAISRLSTYEERIKYKGKQVDNQDRLLFTRYEEQGRRRGHGGSNQSRSQENNFKKETHNNSNKLTHDKSKVMCFKCKEYGHFANRCPLKKEEQSNLIEEDLEPQLLMAIIEEAPEWIINQKESRIRNGRKFHSTST